MGVKGPGWQRALGAMKPHYRWSVVGVSAIAVAMVLSAGLVAAAPDGTHISALSERLAPFRVGAGPDRTAYDPVNHDLYVPETGAHQIQVFNSANSLVGTIALPDGSFPGAAAFDPEDNDIYVTDELQEAVYAIYGTTIQNTITSPFINSPYGIAFDPGEGSMIVTNVNGNTVVAISGSSVWDSITVGTYPFEVAYDPYWSYMLVTNSGSNNVSQINAVNLGLVGSFPVGTEPTGIVFDPADDLDYIANIESANVSVVTGTGFHEATIKGFDGPDGMAFSQANLEVYVTNVFNGKVFVVSGESIVLRESTNATADPVSATYDEYNDNVYVSAWGGGNGKKMFEYT
jgi:YVTN family beta-propeller protein